MSPLAKLALVRSLCPFILAMPAIAGEPCDPGRRIQHLPFPPVAGEFGNALAVTSDLIAIGDPKVPPQSPDQGEGSITLYRRGASEWSIETVIYAPPGRDTEFGGSLVLSGDWLFASSANGPCVYFRGGTSAAPQWSRIEGFRPSYLGWRALAAHQNRVILSEAGRTRLLECDPAEPTQWSTVSIAPEEVGSPVAFAGDLFACVRGYDVRLYRRSGSEWLADGEIVFPAAYGPTSARRPRVSTDGTRVAIGYASTLRQTYAGWVDVYQKPSLEDGWQLETRIEPPQNAPFATTGFGFSVALSGDRLAVGSPDDNFRGGGTGAVYCYRFSNGAWRAAASYHGDPDNPDGQFGYRVAIQDDDLIVTGSGFSTAVNPAVIPFCTDPAAQKTCTPGIAGLFNFVEMFLAGDTAADYTADGHLSLEDLFRFLADWFAGCPQ